MRVILDVEDGAELRAAFEAFIEAAKDQSCRDALKRRGGLVGFSIGRGSVWSIKANKDSFTVRKSKVS